MHIPETRKTNPSRTERLWRDPNPGPRLLFQRRLIHKLSIPHSQPHKQEQNSSKTAPNSSLDVNQTSFGNLPPILQSNLRTVKLITPRDFSTFALCCSLLNCATQEESLAERFGCWSARVSFPPPRGEPRRLSTDTPPDVSHLNTKGDLYAHFCFRVSFTCSLEPETSFWRLWKEQPSILSLFSKPINILTVSHQTCRSLQGTWLSHAHSLRSSCNTDGIQSESRGVGDCKCTCVCVHVCAFECMYKKLSPTPTHQSLCHHGFESRGCAHLSVCLRHLLCPR